MSLGDPWFEAHGFRHVCGFCDFRYSRTHPGYLRRIRIKPVGRIFEICDSNPLTLGKQGSEEIPRSKAAQNAENADTKT